MTTATNVAQTNATHDVDVLVRRPADDAPRVSKTLYGLFLEDINFAADGGLNANLVNNWSFEGAYLERPFGHSQLTVIAFKRKARPMRDPLRHWDTHGGALKAMRSGGSHSDASFARLTLDAAGVASLRNHGYPGDGASIGGRAGVDLEFSAMVRTDDLRGSLTVALVDVHGATHVSSPLVISGEGGWTRVGTTLRPSRTDLYSLEIRAEGSGSVDLDEVSLVPADHWGAGDPRWSQGRLRRDLVQSLADLSPGFLRFPGGCIVEGVGAGNQYDWKTTVGPLGRRVPKFNLWAEGRPDGDYSQSNQVGFYEYFLLCEDLGMEPVPVVWAGLSCQFRSRECLTAGSPEFARVVHDAVDLIDWATGDPATSEWAALRAAAGHPEPFPLRYLGIGNENHGSDYHHHFDAIRAAVDAVRPGMRYVLASGAFPKGKSFDGSWSHARGRDDVIVDEHSYATPQWFIEQSTRYDDYPRTGAKVMVGEYAAHRAFSLGQLVGKDRPNTWQSAVAEAAFLTGVERNADIVEMTCYAPLFALHNAKQWSHNLIEFTPLLVQPTVNYEVQRLFGEGVGDLGLRVELTDETTYVSATGDAHHAVVKLVNTSDRPRRARVCFEGHTSTRAQVVSLSAEPTAHTQISTPTHSRSPLVRREVTVAVKERALTVELAPSSVVRVTLVPDQT